MPQPPEVVQLFLDGARAVATAVSDPAVAAAWDEPSVLEEQRVGGLAGHLARGGVWVVADYLDAGEAPGPADFAGPVEYYATLVGAATADDNRAIRDRGAAIAAEGHEALVVALAERLAGLESRLPQLDPGRLVAVAGRKVLRLDDYLATRIVEQVVHLDDLARSVSHEPWPVPDAGRDLTVEIGLGLARLQRGDGTVIRALYRRGFAEDVFPVL